MDVNKALVQVRHYYDDGIMPAKRWSVISSDMTETECQQYVDAECDRYLGNGEASQPTYYVVDDLSWLVWEDGGKYDYDRCTGRQLYGSTCEKGCADCPHERHAYIMCVDQEIEWLDAHGVML